MEAMRRALEGGSIEPSDEKPSHSDENSSVPPEIGPFTVVATPGHAADHVVFVREGVCFCGDLILGTGSSIVPPGAGGGSLADYMRSLDTVAALDLELLAPGHGPWITDPAAKIAEYREHRLDRERRLIEALGRGERSRAALLAEVWDDVPEQLRPAAAIAMQSHCEKLEAEGRLDRAELID
jgi:glyoxylase-like metal-dependent hydrolase (beta-lactamase superfamily II)